VSAIRDVEACVKNAKENFERAILDGLKGTLMAASRLDQTGARKKAKGALQKWKHEVRTACKI
jgi:hypothetical protein